MTALVVVSAVAAAALGVVLGSGEDSGGAAGADAETAEGEDASDRAAEAGGRQAVGGRAVRGANVVVVMTDDQALAELEAMPRTERLIGDAGARFERYLASFPLCCPSRATYLTGRYAHNHGVLSNSPDAGGGYQALAARHALPVWLRRAGYATAHVGRYLNFYGGLDPLEVPPGWDLWAAPPGSSTYLMYGWELNRDGRIVRHGNRPRDYQTDVYARIAARFVRRQARRRGPFFLSVTPLAPHDEQDQLAPHPFDGPRPAPRHRGALAGLELPEKPSFDEADVDDKPSHVAGEPRLDPEDRRRMAGSSQRRARSLLAVDDLVARLVRELRRSGELRRTYVLFTSDNGFLLGEHRLKGKGSPYEESVHVPLLVRGPGIPPGATVARPAANIDLAPTILEIAGAEADREPDGISLLPAALGRRELPPRAILLQNLDRAKRDRQPRYAGLRGRRWHYVEYETGERELYDMDADPFQLQSLADDPDRADLVARLARRLERLRRCAGASCR